MIIYGFEIHICDFGIYIVIWSSISHIDSNKNKRLGMYKI